MLVSSVSWVILVYNTFMNTRYVLALTMHSIPRTRAGKPILVHFYTILVALASSNRPNNPLKHMIFGVKPFNFKGFSVKLRNRSHTVPRIQNQ